MQEGYEILMGQRADLGLLLLVGLNSAHMSILQCFLLEVPKAQGPCDCCGDYGPDAPAPNALPQLQLT